MAAASSSSSSSSPSPSPSPASQSPAKAMDAEITIVSAKHLKNVNWRHGELKPYAVAYLDQERRVATKPDDFGSTRPVWNERLTLPVPSIEAFLTIEIFHSKPSETPKPLVGSVRIPLKDFIIPPHHPPSDRHRHRHRHRQGHSSPSPIIRTLELRRPSGRPQGKVRVRLSIQEPTPPPAHVTPPEYYMPLPPPLVTSSSPSSSSYYSPPPHHLSRPSSNIIPNTIVPPPQQPPPPFRDYPSYSQPHHYPNAVPPLQQASCYQYGNYSDPYPIHYSATGGYYSAPPAPPRMMQMLPLVYDRPSGYIGAPSGPSAPYDHTSYEQKPKGGATSTSSGGKLGLGAGMAVGAVAGAFGGLALEEGIRYEEDKIVERVGTDLAARDAYNDYRADY